MTNKKLAIRQVPQKGLVRNDMASSTPKIPPGGNSLQIFLQTTRARLDANYYCSNTYTQKLLIAPWDIPAKAGAMTKVTSAENTSVSAEIKGGPASMKTSPWRHGIPDP